MKANYWRWSRQSWIKQTAGAVESWPNGGNRAPEDPHTLQEQLPVSHIASQALHKQHGSCFLGLVSPTRLQPPYSAQYGRRSQQTEEVKKCRLQEQRWPEPWNTGQRKRMPETMRPGAMMPGAWSHRPCNGLGQSGSSQLFPWGSMGYSWDKFKDLGKKRCHHPQNHAPKTLHSEIRHLHVIILPGIWTPAARATSY